MLVGEKLGSEDAALEREPWAALYEGALPSTRTGPLYNAFSYPTKISPEAIALLIATHTSPGDTVLDVFGGSGTTGMAAKLCDRPTPAMLSASEQLDLKPEWGPREAFIYEIGTLGSLVSRVMCDPPEPGRFVEAAERLIALAEAEYDWLYLADDPDGEPGRIRQVIWSDVVACPRCGHETSYWEAAVRREPLRLEKQPECRGCGVSSDLRGWERLSETFYDPFLDTEATRKRRVPVRVYGHSAAGNWSRSVLASDTERISLAEGEDLPAAAPRAEVELGDLYRAGYHAGISHLHHFYTPRNFLALSTLWSLIEDAEPELREPLQALVLSFNASHSTLMTRVVVKSGQGDFVVTGAQSGVLYISGLPVEKNVFAGVRRKVGAMAAAFDLLHGSKSCVSVVQSSSTSLALPDDGVDYVFTDPPFGDYIPYAELNQINELWLGAPTPRAQEIVVSRAAGRDLAAYESMMAEVFSEVARVMGADSPFTLVFHSAKSSVWRALARAFRSAGFAVRRTSVLDKTQASFKQVVSTTSVKGDPLLLLEKAEEGLAHVRASDHELVEAVVAEAADHPMAEERSRERLYSRYITRCLLEDVAVTLDAADFYRLLEAAGQG